MRNCRFISFDNANESDENRLWDYWSKLQEKIDKDDYGWNRMYMIRNIDDLVLIIDKNSDEIVGFYMGSVRHSDKNKSVAPKSVAPKSVAPKLRSNTQIDVPTKNTGKIYISLIQAFERCKGYGTLMLIHAAHRVGMKYNNTDRLKDYISVYDPSDDATGFYEKYGIEMC